MMLLGKACMCFNNNSLILWARCFNLFLGGGGGVLVRDTLVHCNAVLYGMID